MRSGAGAPSVSRVHAVWCFIPARGVVVTDLSSSNGTFVDGRRLPPRSAAEWPEGGVCRFGASTREYVLRLPREGGAQPDAHAPTPADTAAESTSGAADAAPRKQSRRKRARLEQLDAALATAAVGAAPAASAADARADADAGTGAAGAAQRREQLMADARRERAAAEKARAAQRAEAEAESAERAQRAAAAAAAAEAAAATQRQRDAEAEEAQAAERARREREREKDRVAAAVRAAAEAAAAARREEADREAAERKERERAALAAEGLLGDDEESDGEPLAELRVDVFAEQRAARFLSRALREPAAHGLAAGDEWWVAAAALAALPDVAGAGLSQSHLRAVALYDAKGRFDLRKRGGAYFLRGRRGDAAASAAGQRAA